MNVVARALLTFQMLTLLLKNTHNLWCCWQLCGYLDLSDAILKNNEIDRYLNMVKSNMTKRLYICLDAL